MRLWRAGETWIGDKHYEIHNRCKSQSAIFLPYVERLQWFNSRAAAGCIDGRYSDSDWATSGYIPTIKLQPTKEMYVCGEESLSF